MAPKEPFKVHSLSKHIENTKKGLSADAQFNRRPTKRAPAIKQDPDSFDPNNLFKSHGDDDDEAESSDADSSSEGEGASDFLRNLGSAGVKTPVTPSRRNKDVEIADSDIERNASSKRTNATKKAVKAKPEPSDDSSSEDESASEKGEAKAKTNGVTATKASASSSSTSSSSESESDSDSESDSEPTKPTAANDSSSDSSSGESSEDESEDEPEPTTKHVVNGKAAAKSTSSKTKAPPAQLAKKPVEPESDSSSSSEDEDEDEEMVDESMHIEHRQNNTQLAVPNFIAPDFVLRKSEDGANGKDVAEICNRANLEGKQVWYFTVPSNVPISVVQNLEIPLDNSQRGDPVFSHDGEDYGVSFESIAPKGDIQILIPSADGSQYRSASRPVSQVMQIKKTTQLASLPSSAIGPAEKRTPRAQPKGLKSRYQPIGVNNASDKLAAVETSVEADTEMTEAPALATVSKTPKKKSKKDTPAETTPAVAKEKKQKKVRESVAEPSSSLTPSISTPDVSRKGKRKHTSSEQDAAAAAAQLMLENSSAVNSPKKQKTAPSGSPDLGSEPPSASTKKQTPVLPPAFPQISSVSTPVPKSAPLPAPSTSKKIKKTKEPKESKLELPVLPPPSRQTPIPLPAIPHSSQSIPAGSPSVAKEEKRAKKRKEKESAKTPSRKVTPVPPPQVMSSS
ncbi:hypothetical protein AK830_g9599 [Neonectria ditissima]|uniref:Uncharacterized protein n=1 Tax=Neonectria ditissima TaxID=78410 RepID=A0A0P7B953_9HYPO|nr:hypothetical protein AK830_g9599 [Neonectria ditissima]